MPRSDQVTTDSGDTDSSRSRIRVNATEGSSGVRASLLNAAPLTSSTSSLRVAAT